MNSTPQNDTKATDMSDTGQVPVAGADSELLSRIAAFWRVYRDFREKADTSHRLHKGIKAPTGGRGDSPEHALWEAEAKRCGYSAAMVARNEAGVKAGAVANAVFSIPAQTQRGCLEKVKIARLAMGYGDGKGGDVDLEVYQDHATPWIDNALVDLERLAAGDVPNMATPDPAVEAAAELYAAEEHFSGMGAETIEDEKRPEWKAALARLRLAEDQFYRAPVTSPAGAAAKIRALLQEAKDPLGDLDGFYSTVIILESLSAFLDGLVSGDVPAVEVAPALVRGKANPDLERPAAKARVLLQTDRARNKQPIALVHASETVSTYLDKRLAEGPADDPAVAAADAYFAGVANFESAPKEDSSPERQRSVVELDKAEDSIGSTPIKSPAGAAAIVCCIEHLAQIQNGEDDYSHHIVCNLRAQLDKMTAGSTAPAKPDPVAEFARQLRAVKDELDRLDTEGWHERADEEAKQHIAALFAKEDKLTDRISNSQAATAVGALAQVMLANHELARLKANDHPEQEAGDILERGQRLLYLAAATLEGETGIDRVTLGGEGFMPERLNPARQEAETDA